jgi:hypothetical protein
MSTKRMPGALGLALLFLFAWDGTSRAQNAAGFKTQIVLLDTGGVIAVH